MSSRNHPAPFILTIVLLFPGCAAMSYMGYRLTPDYPEDKTEDLTLPGLTDKVRVYFDSWGVPHVEARSEDDLLRAIGFLHGRNRFFQMDMMRRFARGRLSELLGRQPRFPATTVELDISMRAWGIEQASLEDTAALDPPTREKVETYVAGINQALQRYPPIEYSLVRVEPEPWTIADCFAIGRLVGWGVTHNWLQETSRLLIALHGGIERSEQIYPSSPWPGRTSLQATGKQRTLPPAVHPQIRSLFPPRPMAANTIPAAPGIELVGAASNAWVVGGGRTESGKPLLANDPHLSHTLPSVMFQQHLGSPGLDVIGVTVPGLPYVLIGHNRKVAWGITSAMFDAVDLFIEKADPGNPARVIGPQGPEPVLEEELIVRVRDGDQITEHKHRLRKTPRGPLLNDIYPGLLPDHAPLVSVRWAALETRTTPSLDCLQRANRATTVEELRAAMAAMNTPVNSIMAADAQDYFALFATGAVPIRKGYLGTFPAPAWIPDIGWSGMTPAQAMPFDKARGTEYFAHGNNLMQEPDKSEFLLQVDSAPAYRLERICELIEKSPRHNKETTAGIHGDCLVPRARRIVPVLLEDLKSLSEKTPLQAEALQLLETWDYQAPADSAAAAVFFSTYRQILVDALGDEVDAAGLTFLLSQRYLTNASDLWFEDAGHIVWDDRATPVTEGRPELIRRAFRKSVAWLRERLGEDPRDWRWGELHQFQFKHFFGARASLSRFNLPPSAACGEMASVWKTHFDLGNAQEPFRVIAGPVLRMIVDLADMDHAWWITDTGASGWPLSPHYADQHGLWKRMKYIPMVMDWEELRRDAVGVLTLEP